MRSETSIFCPRRNSSPIVTASIRLFFGRILGDERPRVSFAEPSCQTHTSTPFVTGNSPRDVPTRGFTFVAQVIPELSPKQHAVGKVDFLPAQKLFSDRYCLGKAFLRHAFLRQVEDGYLAKPNSVTSFALWR